MSEDAVASLLQIVGIMTDQVFESSGRGRWTLDTLFELEVRLEHARISGDGVVTLGIDDASLLLDGMAFTEMASAELPWFEMVVWTSDFITHELRRHWTEEEWRSLVAGS
jgi:hypothetical protein